MMPFQVQVSSSYVKSRRARSDHNKIRSDQVISCHVTSGIFISSQVMSGQVR